MGSKRRIWKYISAFVLSERKNDDVLYVEPFCGGCNSLCRVTGRRLSADVNPYLIAMWKGLLAGEKVVFDIDKVYYDDVRRAYRENSGKYSDFDKGWVGYMASYNGRFFDGGYSGISAGRNFIRESMADILTQIDLLKGVEFRCCSYDELDIEPGSIIYCDPPYRDTKQYDRVNFDYDKFYAWLYTQRERGNKVYISEYSMPGDFKEIWHLEVKCNINVEKNTRVERLFTL